jgi:hypothetical protein
MRKRGVDHGDMMLFSLVTTIAISLEKRFFESSCKYYSRQNFITSSGLLCGVRRSLSGDSPIVSVAVRETLRFEMCGV